MLCSVCVCGGGGEVECRSSETSLDALPAGSAARPRIRSEGQSSPSGAQAESGDWLSVVPHVSQCCVVCMGGGEVECRSSETPLGALQLEVQPDFR